MTNNTQAQAQFTTVAEIQAAHLSAIRDVKKEVVLAHELFGFSDEIVGVGKLPIAIDRHPLTPATQDDFVFSEALVRRTLLSMACGDSIMLVGEKGTGKTSFATQLHARLNKPMIGITGSNGVDDSYLLGCKTIQDGDVKAVDGVLSYAYRHGLTCLIDEICTLRPGVLVGINDILQGDDLVSLKHHGIDPTLDPKDLLSIQGGMNIVRHPQFRLFATDNTGGKQSRDPRYVGLNTQNAAVRSRFTSLKVGFMTPEKEMKALKGASVAFAHKRKLETSVSDFNIQSMVEFAFRFRKAFASYEVNDNISFREIKRWAIKLMMYGDLDDSFVDAIYTNLEESDQVAAMNEFKATFGRDLILPEEYSISVASQADAFIKRNIENQNAAA
ncbi:AAA family ATPase [Pseudomonas sp. NPDC089569]|uniref:AAA family ATPase n=1 Tax=Pseudomonas sp. NPDC089569 TaxID=3390722 RepID=UPI003D01E542